MRPEHTLKPVMIGKFAKPQCFKNVNMNALYVIYKSQCNAWMDSEIFAEWFKKDLYQLLSTTNTDKTFVHLKLCYWWTIIALPIPKSWRAVMAQSLACSFLQTQLHWFSLWITASCRRPRTATKGNFFKELSQVKMLKQCKVWRKLWSVKKLTVKDSIYMLAAAGKRLVLNPYSKHSENCKFILTLRNA